MRKRLFLMAIVASAALSSGPGAFAQDSSETAPQKKAKAETKPKVWTNDEVDSLRSPSDIYVAEKQQKEKEAQTAANKQSSSAPTKPPAAPPRLSNPKTPPDADAMIAWEQRDIDSEQEYLERLQKQLSDADDSQKAHLQELIQNQIRTIDETRKEKEGLETQRDALAKKAADAANASSSPQ